MAAVVLQLSVYELQLLPQPDFPASGISVSPASEGSLTADRGSFLCSVWLPDKASAGQGCQHMYSSYRDNTC